LIIVLMSGLILGILVPKWSLGSSSI